MTSGFSNNVKDTYMATALSEFTTADIPDMSNHHPESSHWLENYILNSILRANVPSPHREYRFNFLRRAVTAFREHDLARSATLDFLRAGDQPIAGYYLALHHWEQFLGAAWHTIETLTYVAGLDKANVFEKGAGTSEERVNALYNESKHTESRIASGQMPSAGPLPVWLCNAGIKSIDTELTFAETGEVLVDIANWAHALEDPMTTEERVRQLPY